MGRLWIALVLLALDMIGLALLFRKLVPWSLLRWRWAAMGLGVVAAACACLIRHRYTEKYFAIGFPLPGAVFEMSTGSDFVGALTLPILCLDAFLMAALPVAISTIALALRGRRRTS